MTDAKPEQPRPLTPGLIRGGRGGPSDELLEDGQEEVFSRSEVEHGAVEHSSDAGRSGREPRARTGPAD